jgi:D-alanyl-D-alanine carboxypeptidase
MTSFPASSSRRHRRLLKLLPWGAAGALLLGAGLLTAAETPAPSDLAAEVDRAARKVLDSTGVSSASVAIVLDGRVALTRAYGDARRQPRVAARTDMRYPVGSISKQFTASAILLLSDDGKLSLDDPVSRYVPGLTRAGDVTIRQLLSHTSGYQDFWPQDYVPPFMRTDVAAQQILDRWAKKPLDFEPGTQWQYSNTNYVIAGLIVEKVAGVPLWTFFQQRLFEPLGIRSAVSIDRGRLSETDPIGYLRYALGPLRPAPKEGKGWLYAMGELAMTAEDLAKWDVGLLERRLLSPASYREMETEVRLANGLGTRYGLGIDVTMAAGHRVFSHGGEVSGFTATNAVFPDDRAAVCVLTNQDAAGASSGIVEQVTPLLFARGDVTRQAERRAKKVFQDLQRGHIDRSLFTDDANAYFDETAIRDFASSLGPLGQPKEFKQTVERDRGGMTFRRFKIELSKKNLELALREMPDGRIEQYQVGPAD